jgi:hypothetical protein
LELPATELGGSMARLISYDENGEAWFDNPYLTLANPRRRRTPKRNYASAGYTSARIADAESRSHPASYYFGTGKKATKKRSKVKGRMKMAKRRSRKGRMPAGLRRYWAAHRRGKKSTGVRRRRRASFTIKARGRKRVVRGRARGGVVRIRVNPRRRRFSSNPSTGQEIRLPMGLTMPPIDAVLWVGSGVIVAPMISRQVQAVLPASLQSQYTPWLVDIASVLIPGMLLRKFVNPRAGNLFMVGGATNLVFKAVKQFAPSMAVTMGLSGQPLLGKYTNAGGVRRFPAQQSAAPMPGIIGNAPERLNPAGRF